MAFRFAQMTDTHTYGPPPPTAREFLNRELETGCSRDLPLGRAGFNVPPGRRFPCPEYDRVLLDFYRECCRHDVDFVINTGDLITGGAVLAGDSGGHCRCLALADGTERWRLSVDQPILTAPTVSGNTLYFGDYIGRLYAFSWD